jgi:hypothetical protein
MAQRVKKYVSVLESNNVIPPQSGLPVSWAYIFYCIRVGDLKVAEDEIIACCNAGNAEDQALLMNIATLLQLVQAFFNRPLTPQLESEFNIQIRRCKEWLQDYRSDPSVDSYLLNILNLLSLTESGENFGIPFYLEDFLWTHLWFATLSTRLNAGDVSSQFASAEFNSMDRFAQVVANYGSEMFDEDGSKPFNYAVALLACQNFGEAVSYLYKQQQSIAAVHILAVCLYYGLLLPHEALEGPDMRDSITPLGLMSIVVSKTSRVLSGNLDVGRLAQYILSLNSNWVEFARAPVVDDRVLARTSDQAIHVLHCGLTDFMESSFSSAEEMKILVGELDRVGRREGGVLDKYFTPEVVDDLIDRVTKKLRKRDEMNIELMRFFELCGDYSEALYTACWQLSRVLFPSDMFSRGGNVEYCCFINIKNRH